MPVPGGVVVSYEKGNPVWHIQDSQGQIMALDVRQKPVKRFELFPFSSEALGEAPFLEGGQPFL